MSMYTIFTLLLLNSICSSKHSSNDNSYAATLYARKLQKLRKRDKNHWFIRQGTSLLMIRRYGSSFDVLKLRTGIWGKSKSVFIDPGLTPRDCPSALDSGLSLTLFPEAATCAPNRRSGAGAVDTLGAVGFGWTMSSVLLLSVLSPVPVPKLLCSRSNSPALLLILPIQFII